MAFTPTTLGQLSYVLEQATGQTPSSGESGYVGIGIGIVLGSVISGGYSVCGKSGNWVVKVWVAAGYAICMAAFPDIDPRIGAIFGGVLSGLSNRAFGRRLTEAGIEGTFCGEKGFAGHHYQYYLGGWCRSDLTKYGNLPDYIQHELARPYRLICDQVACYASVLRLPADRVVNFTYQVRINLHGLKQEEAACRAAEVLGKAHEAMARHILES